MAASPLKLIKTFFGMNLAEMKAEFTTLPAKDREDLTQGLTPDPATGEPSYTY